MEQDLGPTGSFISLWVGKVSVPFFWRDRVLYID